jgi:hypothetical protein
MDHPNVPADRSSSMSNTFVFVCGLHRSGTSILYQILRSQEGISGFRNTGVPEDEGQHLQSVFLPAKAFGGPGFFGFNPAAAMTDTHSLVTKENSEKLFQEWSRYLDLAAPLLIEKSPSNIIRTRFLQAMFPRSYFIIVVRHPLAVSMATQKWAHAGLSHLMHHWLHVHQIFDRDKLYLEHCCVVSYEQMVNDPSETFAMLGRFLGIDVQTEQTLANHNDKYFEKIKAPGLLNRWKKYRLETQFEKKILPYGYSLEDLARYPAVS